MILSGHFCRLLLKVKIVLLLKEIDIGMKLFFKNSYVCEGDEIGSYVVFADNEEELHKKVIEKAESMGYYIAASDINCVELIVYTPVAFTEGISYGGIALSYNDLKDLLWVERKEYDKQKLEDVDYLAEKLESWLLDV